MKNFSKVLFLSSVCLSCSAWAKCLSYGDSLDPCRYEKGDAWCESKNEETPYAYNDACLAKKANAGIKDTLGRSLGEGFFHHYWLPDKTNASLAKEAIGIAYFDTGGSGSSIKVGLFKKSGTDFVLVGTVRGLYGDEARNAQFSGDRIEVTTRMPKPEDARCCPTGVAEWRIDRRSLNATRLR